MQYIYLHGFASGPDSTKARFFADTFQRRGLSLLRPDLNDDFSHLTITRQLEKLRRITSAFDARQPITLIGSSMGGLVAILYSGLDSRVRRLVLLAPAVGFHRILKSKAGAKFSEWKKNGYMPVEHYALGKTLPLHFGIYTDAMLYRKATFTRALPTLIFHGLHDDTVAYKNSITLVEQNARAGLMLLNSDHALNDCLETIDSQVQAFFERNSH
jgi:pimeloyl-ACP methyl ester carboxylesterase